MYFDTLISENHWKET